MNINHVLFDLNGTLFDLKKCEKSALDSTFKVYGIELSNNQCKEYEKINTELWGQFEKGLISQDEVLVKRFEIFLKSIKNDISPKQLNEMYLYFLGGNFYLEHGAIDILLRLRDKYHLYVVTNGVEMVQLKKMKSANIFQFFDDIFSAETIGHQKPEYSFYKYCLEKINCFPEECLIVGDSLVSDIRGGINAEMHTCWYNPLNKENLSEVIPEYIVYKLIDISKVISKINTN